MKTSTTKRLRFIHIPKTAGATLRVLLLRQYHGRRIFSFHGQALSDIQRYMDLSERQKRELQLFMGHMSLFTGIEDVDSATAITLLRDPISRVKSLCQYVFEGNWQAYPIGSFDLDCFLNSGEQQLFNHQTRFFINTGPDSSLHLINSMSAAAARDLALENLFHKVTCFGIQECFDESLMLFAEFLNWDMPFYKALHVKNSAKLLDFKQSHLDQIAELNSIDIEVYNAAKRKFLELLAGSNLHPAKLLRFRFLNQRLSPLLKLRARIKGQRWQ